VKRALTGTLGGEIVHELFEVAHGLGLITAVQSLLELLYVKTTFGVASAETFGNRFSVRVGGAQVRVSGEDFGDVLVHVPSLSNRFDGCILARSIPSVIGLRAALSLPSSEARRAAEYCPRGSPRCALPADDGGIGAGYRAAVSIIRPNARAFLADLRAVRPIDVRLAALAATGLSNEQIADRLVLSVATAKTHVSRAMVKLGVRDRAQLVVLAYESGLVRPGWVDPDRRNLP
jgi:DNA-binding CsgD family transcriptional regulator